MTEAVPTDATLNLTRGFHWSEVPPERGLAARALRADPDLGAIAAFKGTFVGKGFNTIFRPQNFAASPTQLPNPAHGANDNILELNPTTEQLKFSDPIGSIPNRGFAQGDVFLNGIRTPA